jgi:predicted nucleotidyltransferase
LQARNYLYNAERYKQIKLIKQYPQLAVIVEDVLRKCGGHMTIIFGSYAKFTAKKDSDIDIYIESTDENVKKQIESVHSKIRVKIGRFDSSSELVKEMIKNHVILRGVEEFYEKTKFFE